MDWQIRDRDSIPRKDERNFFCSRTSIRQSQWPRGLRRRSAAARLQILGVRIPLEAWMSVCCKCCVLSCIVLCVGLIIRPEESYRLWCVVVCDLETSWMRRTWPTGGGGAVSPNKTKIIYTSNRDHQAWYTVRTSETFFRLRQTQREFDHLHQCFSTVGPRPCTGPWHQLYRAARCPPGICHFSFLTSFHE
jgi:hypothetical protein